MVGGREKGKFPKPKKKKGKSLGPKGRGECPAHNFWDPIPLGNHSARTHARTKRNELPVEHPPTSDASSEGSKRTNATDATWPQNL